MSGSRTESVSGNSSMRGILPLVLLHITASCVLSGSICGSQLPLLLSRRGGSRPPTRLPPQWDSQQGRGSSLSPLRRRTEEKWSSDNYDERPLIVGPRTVETLKARDSRNGLLRKVYLILTCQLLVTALTIWTFLRKTSLVNYLLSPGGVWTIWASILTSIVSLLLITFRYGRVFPANLGLLALFTAGESVLLALYSSFHSTQLILRAALQTGIAFLGLTCLAFRPSPRFDLTPFGASLAAVSFVFVSSLGIAQLFRLPLSETFVSGAGALLFSIYLVMDTQRIVGGKGKKHQLDDRDYVIGAAELYVDVTRLFMYVLRLLADREKESRR